MRSRQEIEAALDSGRLFAKMRNGRAWQARRNGATKLWKTRPDEFRIPFKVGFKTCGAIDHMDLRCFDEFYEILEG